MSNSILKFFQGAFGYLVDYVSSDNLFLICLFLIVIVSLGMIAYKLSSDQADVLFSSRSLLRFISKCKEARRGTVNYLMKSFPEGIRKAWEEHTADIGSRPSAYLNLQLIKNPQSLEWMLFTLQSVVSVLCIIAAVGFSFAESAFAMGEKLIFILIISLLALLFAFATRLVFACINRAADKKFAALIRALNVANFNLKIEKTLMREETSKDEFEENNIADFDETDSAINLLAEKIFGEPKSEKTSLATDAASPNCVDSHHSTDFFDQAKGGGAIDVQFKA